MFVLEIENSTHSGAEHLSWMMHFVYFEFIYLLYAVGLDGLPEHQLPGFSAACV
jgi:hypothetical protein